ncbi:MAG: bifunctional pyr operon transcriptional regulator/uracil phosphoribosyltransferase PyrR [Pseudomonadota bacterium]
MEKIILNSQDLDRIIKRIAHEIIDKNSGSSNLAIVGIRQGGTNLADAIASEIASIEAKEVDLGYLDINLYRDDLTLKNEQPVLLKTEINFSIDKKNIVLIDDVFFTGRTTRAALDALIDLGRPDSIQLAVIIDRGFHELPIRPDYVGKEITTIKTDNVKVVFGEDKDNKVFVI